VKYIKALKNNFILQENLIRLIHVIYVSMIITLQTHCSR